LSTKYVYETVNGKDWTLSIYMWDDHVWLKAYAHEIVGIHMCIYVFMYVELNNVMVGV